MSRQTIQILHLEDERSGFPEWFVLNVPDEVVRRFGRDFERAFSTLGNDFTYKLVTKFAKEKELPNGSAIKLYEGGYRNKGLLFWDESSQEIVVYKNRVPPQFRVGPDGISPDSWLSVMSEGSVVFPTSLFMKQIHEAYIASGEESSFEVNGLDFFKSEEIPDWNSFMIHVQQDYPYDYTAITYDIYPTEPENFILERRVPAIKAWLRSKGVAEADLNRQMKQHLGNLAPKIKPARGGKRQTYRKRRRGKQTRHN
jgi:hypothetical protein